VSYVVPFGLCFTLCSDAHSSPPFRIARVSFEHVIARRIKIIFAWLMTRHPHALFWFAPQNPAPAIDPSLKTPHRAQRSQAAHSSASFLCPVTHGFKHVRRSPPRRFAALQILGCRQQNTWSEKMEREFEFERGEDAHHAGAAGAFASCCPETSVLRTTPRNGDGGTRG